MSEDFNKLQRMLEQATAAEGVPGDELEPEARSLREAWLDFGRLLEAAQPEPFVSPLPTNLRSVPEEGPGVRTVSRRARTRRWLFSSAALVAASLLIGMLTTWTPREADQSKSVAPAAEQTAAIKTSDPTLVSQEHPTVSVSDDPQWDDTLDEQIAQVGWQMLYARQDVYAATGAGSVQYGIEQMQKDLAEDNL